MILCSNRYIRRVLQFTPSIVFLSQNNLANSFYSKAFWWIKHDFAAASFSSLVIFGCAAHRSLLCKYVCLLTVLWRLWSKNNFNLEIQKLVLNMSVTFFFFFGNKVRCVADGKKVIQMISLIHRCRCFSVCHIVSACWHQHILFFAFRLVKITMPQVGPRKLNLYAHIIIDPLPASQQTLFHMDDCDTKAFVFVFVK